MKWLKQFRIIRRRNKAELENIRRRNITELGIISILQQIDLSDKDRDNIIDTIKDELDKQFKWWNQNFKEE